MSDALVLVAGRTDGGVTMFTVLLACGHRSAPAPAGSPVLTEPGFVTWCRVCGEERQLHLLLQVTQ